MKIFFINKIPIIISPLICKIFGRFLNLPIAATAIFPFIFVKNENILKQKDVINHELIHIYQYLDTILIGLVIIAPLQYLYARYILRKSKWEAYYFMSHEQEAHQNDRNVNYLKERKFGSFYKYLLPKNRRKFVYENGKRKMIG